MYLMPADGYAQAMWSVLVVGALASDVVSLVATTASGGVGSGRFALELPDLGVEVRSVRAVHGAMVFEREALVAVDGREATVAAFLGAPRHPTRECVELGWFRAREARYEVVFELTPGQAPAAEPTGSWRRCEGPEGPVDWLGDGPPSLQWEHFEHRLALEVATDDGSGAASPTPTWVIGRPQREFARRVALLDTLLDGRWFVDGGDFVDGASSVAWGQLSLHRPLGFDTLRRLDPVALVPGRQELAAGAVSWRAEADDLPYTAANWEVADDGSDELVLPPWLVRTTDAGVRVGFVGVVAPAVAREVPVLATEGVVLADPVASVQRAVDALRAPDAPGGPVDLVVLLCDGRLDLVRSLQQGVRGVDVLVGDPGPSVDRLDTVDVLLQEPYAATDRAALTLPADGVAWVDLTVDDGTLVSARLRPARITAEIDPDEATMARISAVRRDVYPAVDRPLLGAPPDAHLERWTDAAWQKLLCEAVRESLQVDAALLPAFGPPPTVPGPLTEKLVLDQVATLDALQVHEVRGDLLPRLLDKAYEVVPNACGAPLGSASPKVGGRSVDPQRIYRVATTDRLQAGAAAGLFAEARSSWLLDQPTVHLPRTDDGVLTVPGSVRQGLMAADAAELSSRSETDVQPLWLWRMTRVSLSAVGFQGVDDARYEQVPETLATSPSSLTLLGDLDTGLEYSDARLAWDARQRLTFTRLSSEGLVSEPADDLRLSSSVTVPALAVKLGSAWAPYSEALLDSELTAVEEEDGTINPHQADASLTLGAATAAGPISRLRLGAFLLRDLSVLDKPWEAGGRAEATVYVSLGHGLSWTTTLDGFVFADTPTADASDLRFKALVDTRLALPLARWLSLAPYAQVFAFAGRIPDTEAPAASTTVGTALDLAGAMRL